MFFALAAVAAIANWLAVERENKNLEYVAKPLTTLLLLGAALALTPYSGAERGWFVAALVFCLLGDVWLMLPRDAFVLGLASFLVGHVCFLAGFVASEPHPRAWFFPVAAVVWIAVPRIAAPIVRGARQQDSALVAPVLVYIAALVLLFTFAAATGHPLAALGAGVFVLSDTILATNRFVRPLPHGHRATMVTYHAALAVLVASLR